MFSCSNKETHRRTRQDQLQLIHHRRLVTLPKQITLVQVHIQERALIQDLVQLTLQLAIRHIQRLVQLQVTLQLAIHLIQGQTLRIQESVQRRIPVK